MCQCDIKRGEEMKRVLIALLLLLALIVGFGMPELWLHWKDKTLETVQTINLSEPILKWESSKSTDEIREAEGSGEEIAYRLRLFESGPKISIPQSSAVSVDTTWVSEHAIQFLTKLFEVEPSISGFIMDYRFAWFENGMTVPVWSVEMAFNDHWHCVIDIDEESGTIMRCVIQSNGQSFAALFPDSFERSGQDEFSPYFKSQVALRFCEALQHTMCFYDRVSISAWPTSDYDGVNITITDKQTTSITTAFNVYPPEGVWFNYFTYPVEGASN